MIKSIKRLLTSLIVTKEVKGYAAFLHNRNYFFKWLIFLLWVRLNSSVKTKVRYATMGFGEGLIDLPIEWLNAVVMTQAIGLLAESGLEPDRPTFRWLGRCTCELFEMDMAL